MKNILPNLEGDIDRPTWRMSKRRTTPRVCNSWQCRFVQTSSVRNCDSGSSVADDVTSEANCGLSCYEYEWKCRLTRTCGACARQGNLRHGFNTFLDSILVF
eukprot:scaffold358_cov343-Pavlova_lutheri.AAC.22